MKRWIGNWIIGVGIIHSILGFFLFAAPLREIVEAGFWNSLRPSTPLRYLAFWFMFGGVVTILVGYLANWIEGVAGRTLPRPLGWTLLGVALAGVILTPVSGFWLVFPAAFGTLAQSRKTANRA